MESMSREPGRVTAPSREPKCIHFRKYSNSEEEARSGKLLRSVTLESKDLYFQSINDPVKRISG